MLTFFFYQDDDETPTVMLKDSIDLRELNNTTQGSDGCVMFEVKEEDDMYEGKSYTWFRTRIHKRS